MPPIIQECKTRLRTFLDGLPKSEIRFRYFTRNMDGPVIAENMSEWYVGGVQCFIVKGVSEPWSYTYSLPSIKNIITNATTTSSVVAYEPEKTHGLVTGGNGDDDFINTHITIGVTGYRDDPNLWMKTHKTFYRERDIPNTWDRSDIECNFILNDDIVNKNTQCYFANRKSDKFGQTYESDKLTTDVIEQMNKIYCGVSDGGAVSTVPKVYVRHHGNRYLLRKGKRGGEYIQLSNGKKVYNRSLKQAGGKQTPITYKGAGFSDGLVDFLYEHVITKVKLYRNDFESAVILYDEQSQLADNANKQIVVMYDFRDDFRVFYIDALKAMTAYYASKEPSSSITETERTCYQEFLTLVEAPRQAQV